MFLMQAHKFRLKILMINSEEHPNLESSIELQKIFLMHELETIYPITSSGENRYQILSVELPRNFQNIDSNEDEVSAALGFICHSVVMMSKYLSVPLRYRIVCNSSRSAIQEDGTKIMPLFQSRVVERDQLNRGVQLLTRNIDCILESRRIPIKEGAHMLAKLKDIYDGVKAF
mmetsp:Transcript_39605/g.55812  ORF Transcript_39605/g.55812 Transcript_39605/m.55812 type:complete len:173 (-) Transcript_39605:2119-2637(-)